MKILSLLLCFTIIGMSCFATVELPFKTQPSVVKKQQNKINIKAIKSQISLGRECCEQSGYDANGNLITVEACAGWFLSNSANAHERACDKALAALEAVIPNL